MASIDANLIQLISSWDDLPARAMQSILTLSRLGCKIEVTLLASDLARLINNQYVLEYYNGSPPGSPTYAGRQGFLAHKNTRIAAGVAGIAVVVLAGPVAWAPAAIGSFSTVTIGGIAEASVVVASSYAIVRAGDDIEATLNDRQRTLVSQGLDKINA